MSKPSYSIQYAPGSRIAERYVIRRLLGEGGYGVVYEAEQLSTAQSVAIKMLRPQPDYSAEEREELLSRFHREIRLMGQLHHPNSIRLLDSGITAEGARFVVLEFLEGKDLEHTIKTRGALEPRVTHRIVAAVLEALGEAHEHGIVHRDIKPGNIMLIGSLKRPAVKVLDFGIATIQEGFRSENYEQLTMAGQTRGTPAYMAPEQLQRNEVSPRTDLYATGLVLLECLMGRRAVQGANAIEVCLKQLDRDIDFPDTIRRGPFGDIIARAIAYDPTQRYATADEMLSDLERVDVSGLVDLASLELTTPPVPGADDELPDGAPTQAMAAIPVHRPDGPPERERTLVLDEGVVEAAETVAAEADAPRRLVDDGIKTQALPRVGNPSLERLRGLDNGVVQRHVATTAPLPSIAVAPAVGRTPASGSPALVRPRRGGRGAVVALGVLVALTAAAAAALWWLELLG